MNTITILSVAATNSLIKAIKTRAKNVQRDIHIAACSTLDHMREHGDYTGAVALMNALPTGQRVKGLAAWYKNFSGGKFTLRQDKKAGNAWVGALNKDRAQEDFDIDGSMEVTFADFTQEKEPTAMTAEKLMKYLTNIITNDEILPSGDRKIPAEVAALAEKMLQVAA